MFFSLHISCNLVIYLGERFFKWIGSIAINLSKNYWPILSFSVSPNVRVYFSTPAIMTDCSLPLKPFFFFNSPTALSLVCISVDEDDEGSIKSSEPWFK